MGKCVRRYEDTKTFHDFQPQKGGIILLFKEINSVKSEKYGFFSFLKPINEQQFATISCVTLNPIYPVEKIKCLLYSKWLKYNRLHQGWVTADPQRIRIQPAS